MNKITYDERKAVYQEAIEKYGINHQLNKFDEELGEFLAEYGRMRNGEGDRDKFAEELGDLSIMLEQMRLVFGVNDLVCEHMDMKINRLRKRLVEAEDYTQAIQHFEYGLTNDIFSEPVATYARLAIKALREAKKKRSLMKVENGKIVEATENEMFRHYLDHGFDDIFSFPDYLFRCQVAGTVILKEDDHGK